MVPAILKNIGLIEVQKYLLQKELNVDQPVESLGVSLLQREAALVDVLEDVVLADGEEVVHGHDVVHGLGQDPDLVSTNESSAYKVSTNDSAPGSPTRCGTRPCCPGPPCSVAGSPTLGQR